MGAGGASPARPSIRFEEWRGSASTKVSRTAVVVGDPSSIYVERYGNVRMRFGGDHGAFVPEGFPGGVTPDYVPFQIWDSSQALLSAIGVGEKSATVIGATFQWFLRDFAGMLGGVLFSFYQLVMLVEQQELPQLNIFLLQIMQLTFLLRRVVKRHLPQ